MDPTQNTAFVIFAALSPLLIALVKQSGWSRQANAMVAFACYIVIGIAGAIVSGEPLTIENAVNLVTVATVVGTAAYNLIWDNIGAQTDTDPSLDERLTAATSIVR
jgi:O-antigen/teichoic acid export membrane protein